MSDTPRTDEAEIRCIDEPVEGLGMVEVDVARGMERELAAVTAERDRLRERIALLERIGNRMAPWCNDKSAAGDWRMAMDPAQTAIPCQGCDGTGIAAGCDCPDCGGSGIAGWRATP
jgi:hypothetical protein